MRLGAGVEGLAAGEADGAASVAFLGCSCSFFLARVAISACFRFASKSAVVEAPMAFAAPAETAGD